MSKYFIHGMFIDLELSIGLEASQYIVNKLKNEDTTMNLNRN